MFQTFALTKHVIVEPHDVFSDGVRASVPEPSAIGPVFIAALALSRQVAVMLKLATAQRTESSI